VGQAILEKITDTTVICLVHRIPVDSPNVVSITGDISKANLGLSKDDFSDLAKRVDYVIHSAASTSFGESKDFMTRTNVKGTHNVIALAQQAEVPFCHISTAFAHLEQIDASHLSNAYESSKLEAEDVVRKSGLPYVILRPSVVIGDSQDGSMSRFQGFHFLCDLMVRGVLPVWVPTLPTAYMDFIPQDIIGDAVAALVHRPDVTGEFWLASGDRAMTVGTAVALWEQHIPRLTGRAIKPLRYVKPDVIDRLIRPVFLPSLPARTQMMVNQALELLSFSMEAPLPTSLPDLEATLGMPHMPDPELCLIRNAEFWARKRGFLQERPSYE
jgi:thioester reductase-like protein